MENKKKEEQIFEGVCIKIKTSTWSKLNNLKTKPKDTFDSVILKLIEKKK